MGSPCMSILGIRGYRHHHDGLLRSEQLRLSAIICPFSLLWSRVIFINEPLAKNNSELLSAFQELII